MSIFSGKLLANSFSEKINSIPLFSSMFSSKCKYNSTTSSNDIYVTNLNTLNFTNYFVFGFVYNVVIGVALHIAQKIFCLQKNLIHIKLKYVVIQTINLYTLVLRLKIMHLFTLKKCYLLLMMIKSYFILQRNNMFLHQEKHHTIYIVN